MVENLSESNDYQQLIIPTINEAQKGDELIFMSPSTFFRFYTFGAKTYEAVCQALRDSRVARGVKCRVLIDVRGILTALAGATLKGRVVATIVAEVVYDGRASAAHG